MSSDSSINDASTSDYRYWRSQRRPTGESDEARDKRGIFYDAVCNRFGEELGQRLDRLIWPQIPPRVKRLAGTFGGRVLPLFLAADGARKAVTSLRAARATGMAARMTSELELGQILVSVDGRRVALEFDGLGDLYRMLTAAQVFWIVSPLFAEDRFVQVNFDGDPSSGRFQVWGGEELITERTDVSQQDTYEYLANFLRSVSVLRVAQQMGIDLEQPAQNLDKDQLKKFLVIAEYVASSLSTEAS
jgi:hypothetical protein